jgi:hypothetical protein
MACSFSTAHAYHVAVDPAFTDTIVFSSPLVEIGAFRCDAAHPCFSDSGPAEHNLFVFPRSSVIIQHEHERPFVTNPNIVTTYNLGQAYRRQPISARGHYCDWFGVDRRDCASCGHVALPVVQGLPVGDRPDPWRIPPASASSKLARKNPRDTSPTRFGASSGSRLRRSAPPHHAARYDKHSS